MAEHEDKSEVKEPPGGKAVARQSGVVSPFRGMEERFERMERFMDRMTDGLLSRRWMRPFEREWPTWFEGSDLRAPAVDLIDRENEILLRAELPGVRKEDISISLTADSITIEARSKQEEAEEKGDYRRREISSSAFSRSMSLPAEVDTDAAKAVFKDGVLEVTLPKKPAAKGKTVPIE